jgi:hypothetical protein
VRVADYLACHVGDDHATIGQVISLFQGNLHVGPTLVGNVMPGEETLDAGRSNLLDPLLEPLNFFVGGMPHI